MPCCGGKTPTAVTSSIRSNDPESTKNKTSPPNASYSIKIKTGNVLNSKTNGPVHITIFGDDNKQTDEILLIDSKKEKSFEQDSLKEIQVEATDIGKPQRLIIRHEDNTNEWFIDYIQINVHNYRIRFEANRWLSESKHDRKLSAELFGSEGPAINYDIEVQTGDEQTDPFDSPVYIQIYGAAGRTSKIFLDPKGKGFVGGSAMKLNFSSNNVGEIEKILIGHEQLGTTNDWFLQSVIIQADGQDPQQFYANKWLSSTKDDKQIFVELTRRAPSPIASIYFATVQTADIHQSCQIQMSIRGTKGQTDKIILKDHLKPNNLEPFQKGSIDQFEIKHRDVGDIKSITIGYDENEPNSVWLLESVDIKHKDTVYHFRAQCWLSTRLGSSFSWVTLKPAAQSDDIDYQVIVETGESGIDANVMLCIYGDKKTTRHLALESTQRKFDKNSRLEIPIQAADVGKIKKINIGYDGEGNDEQWFIKSVVIEKKDENYTFPANRLLNRENQTFIDLFPEQPPEPDQILYEITVITSSDDESGTDSGVFMTIYGETTQTQPFQLTATKQNSENAFKQGQTDEFQLELNDVGDIKKIRVRQDGTGLHPIWHLQTVQIRKGSEIYTFNADTILDLSMTYIDLLPALKKAPTPPPSIGKADTSRSNTPATKVKEALYNISVRVATHKKAALDDSSDLQITIFGNDGQTKMIPLKTAETELQTIDVGTISKLVLQQGENEAGVTWYVDHVIIKKGDETTTFYVQHSIKPNTGIEVHPSAILADTDYEIKISTGEKTFEGNVLLKIQGSNGLILIPLSQTKSGDIPFQSKATDEFTCRTTDVGRIKRIVIEHNATKKGEIWYLKKMTIIKGGESYRFNANIRLDYKDPKPTFYPVEKRSEDFVQTELRRLKQSLRTEATKMRRPAHKAHEPFVYNDLSPYFDTSSVEKAIHEPLETPPGYYTRLTALRIVEPWEAYGMDYGVNYELLKQRRPRGQSAKRALPTQNGLMILPPLSLPYGGQMTYVSPVKLEHSRTSSAATAKRRSLAKPNNEQIAT